MMIIVEKRVLGQLFLIFREGRADISDDFRSGRPRISDSDKNVQISALMDSVPE